MRVWRQKGADPCDHRQSQEAHEDGHEEGELLLVRSQSLWPVVHEARHQGLHAAELAVYAQGEQHHEEEPRPEGGGSQGQHHLRVDQEGQAGAALHHVPNVDTLGVGHVAEDGEDDGGREEAGEGVDGADDDGVPVAVLVELVVAAQSQEGPDSNPVGVEDLGASV